jgi:hypothetical protein
LFDCINSGILNPEVETKDFSQVPNRLKARKEQQVFLYMFKKLECNKFTKCIIILVDMVDCFK